jgi:hypothetical protein
MPAIQPARLRQQAALLAEYFDQPEAFIRSLHHLLEFYADRARRPGQSGMPAPLLQAYNVHPPVLRQILYELAPLAQAEPEQALILADAFWQWPYLEFRLLAAGLLGRVPASSAEPVIEMLQAWLGSAPELRLVDALLEDGLGTLRRQAPERMIKLIESWLSGSNGFLQHVGLQALRLVIEDREYVNLPVFFRLIQPWCRSAPSALRPYLLDVLRSLARRSPQETAFFLRQTLEMPENPDTAWLIRQVLGAFPEDARESLRAAAREGPRPGK